jgi:hypothetical protein
MLQCQDTANICFAECHSKKAKGENRTWHYLGKFFVKILKVIEEEK